MAAEAFIIRQTGTVETDRGEKLQVNQTTTMTVETVVLAPGRGKVIRLTGKQEDGTSIEIILTNDTVEKMKKNCFREKE